MERIAVTGGAGFIGSNLVDSILDGGSAVVVVDNFTTGREQNLAAAAARAGERIEIVRGDINDGELLRRAFSGARYVFHQAAMVSVPKSVADPLSTHHVNVTGTLSVLLAARDARVERVVVASSCAVYGDEPSLPKHEQSPLRPLSPYALSKLADEEYCRLFGELYGLATVCLRYFNVFGPRQDPRSEYAAVIPKFAERLVRGERPAIYGDGEQTRDFVYVGDLVEANWVAATHPAAAGEVFNIACGKQTSLNALASAMNAILGSRIAPIYEAPRPGEIRHSVADVSKAARVLGFKPRTSLEQGLERILEWYGKTPWEPQ